MQNGLILFQSKYGAARRYAGWLAEATGFPLYPAKDVAASTLPASRGSRSCGKTGNCSGGSAAQSWRWGRPPPTRRQLKRCGNST